MRVDLQPRAPGPDPAHRVGDADLRAALMMLSPLYPRGGHANEAPQAIRSPTDEVLRCARADKLLTLKGAHPTADVVHDGG